MIQKHNLTPEADLRQPSTSQGCRISRRDGQLATMLSHNPYGAVEYLLSWHSALLPDGY